MVTQKSYLLFYLRMLFRKIVHFSLVCLQTKRKMEPIDGIEPPYLVYKTSVKPLNYTGTSLFNKTYLRNIFSFYNIFHYPYSDPCK